MLYLFGGEDGGHRRGCAIPGSERRVWELWLLLVQLPFGLLKNNSLMVLSVFPGSRAGTDTCSLLLYTWLCIWRTTSHVHSIVSEVEHLVQSLVLSAMNRGCSLGASRKIHSEKAFGSFRTCLCTIFTEKGPSFVCTSNTDRQVSSLAT